MKIRNEVDIPFDNNFFDEDFTEYEGVQCEQNKLIVFLDGGIMFVDEYDDCTIQEYPIFEMDSFAELQLKFPDWKMTRPINRIIIIIKEG